MVAAGWDSFAYCEGQSSIISTVEAYEEMCRGAMIAAAGTSNQQIYGGNNSGRGKNSGSVRYGSGNA